MRTVISIQHIEPRTDKNGEPFWRTHAILQKDDDPLDLEEAIGYGNDYSVGERVEAWFDEEWNTYKMQKSD